MTLAVPSALEYVGPAVELIAGQAPASLSPRRVRFNLRTALAEALANAIAYGNRHDTSRLVRVRVEADRHGVRIHVRDDGAGFDAAAAPDPTLPQNPAREVGRGLCVLRHVVEHVARQAAGHEIVRTLRAAPAAST